jgi:hypothetical protein
MVVGVKSRLRLSMMVKVTFIHIISNSFCREVSFCIEVCFSLTACLNVLS